jgi:hypothetical protein
MDVEKAIALVSAAGIELTDKRRDGSGWSLSFANGATLEVKDSGELAASGKGADEIGRLLDLPGAAGAG